MTAALDNRAAQTPDDPCRRKAQAIVAAMTSDPALEARAADVLRMLADDRYAPVRAAAVLNLLRKPTAPQITKELTYV